MMKFSHYTAYSAYDAKIEIFSRISKKCLSKRFEKTVLNIKSDLTYYEENPISDALGYEVKNPSDFTFIYH